ncbi:glycerophosphodiester phosphodiesterase family protein [Limnoraphis robusta Tam1]|uniref:glycerophosphodiester phosphodiesterase n=1 Tax=Limnoraphis robusta CCNP1315 TaxID=3110306 RepID=A0ABU5TXV7_9CYAN|nr:glycerophosphodiester phosphodiesterase family protein [Limnoraphis robusta]MEA5519782.1 glycerophosphodiester phosphodiesterase family protein [Limnoraphis robusta CCNP1315]MEA5540977.1 glycerophosphodiester phosphodiesterase family protein [Limnoraphis robusta Tam1]MEA5549078.1 glycerophosphodiester phosphodiesterase family protein [Limnoraphis robusta CCNP1324]
MENIKLVGFASLPADTFAEGPPAGGNNGNGEPVSGNGRTGPFDGQPVQGFSGVQFAPGSDGNTFWFLSDNGFGNIANSSDYLLRLYQVDPNFVGTENGDASVEVQGFVQLSDPNNLVPFEIINAGTEDRFLTGTDFDIESIVVEGDSIWIGDEFGPYLLEFNLDGELQQAPIATPNIPTLNTLNGQEPIVIGHRGASGERPEHTLEAYKLAIEQGADFIEPDLVSTKDGVLVARHENEISGTTDVSERPEFADRFATKIIDGQEISGWFTEDFTLEELKTLNAKERIPELRGTDFDNDGLKVPTLAEVIDLVKQVEAETGKQIGIYPETKHPTYFDSIDLSLEEPLINTLVENEFTDPNRIFIQSFEVGNLQDLHNTIMPEAGVDIPLVQLIGGGGAPYDFIENGDGRTYNDLITPEGLAEIATYADGIGPSKRRIIPAVTVDNDANGEPDDLDGDGQITDADRVLGEATSLIDEAHDAGLLVHPYTLRNESVFLASDYNGNPEVEYEQFIQLGADGFFTDFPLTGDQVRDQIVGENVRAPQNADLQFNSLSGEAPLVIAHRGASGDRPEHTLEAYKRAIAQGADFIEPDLVPTKDGVLIARHENALATVQLDENGNIVLDENGNPIITSETTNVAELEQFADRLTVKEIDGDLYGGWFSEDFTLAEIKELKARERIPGVRPDNTEFNDQFEIPTLSEVIDLVKQVEAETGKTIGIYPETKHPTFFEKEGTFLDGTPINIDTSEILVDTLVQNEFTDPSRIFIQSFEIENLLELQTEFLPEAGIDIPLVQLLGDFTLSEGSFSFPYDVVYNFGEGNVNATPEVYADFPIEFSAETDYGKLANPEVIDYIGSAYAEGLGPWKNSFILRESIAEPVDGNGDGNAQITSQLTGEILPLVDWAHDAGMQVHPYTLRIEENFLTLNPDGTPQTLEDEVRQLTEIGVDGFFIDNPVVGRIVVDQEIELPNLSTSRGFEGMAYSPDLTTLYPLLEGSVTGDPENALRIYEFDVESSSYTGLVGFYPTDVPGHAIGDFTPINETEFLVIERDNNQGEAAAFKKIFKIDISQVDDNGFVEKEELVDLLNIADPDDLNGDGETTFSFPFVTIEDVLVLDEKTILVANDNNYPFSVGRGPDIDNNEIIQLELDEPLNLDPRLGVPSTTVEPTDGDDILAGSANSDIIAGLLGNDVINGGDGDDILRGDLNSRSPGGSIGGNDTISGGLGNDQIGGKGGNDLLFGDEGDDLIWGDDGDDIIRGGLGNDTLTGDDFSGGQGSDTFILAVGEGTDTIVDFELGIDVIALANLTFTDLNLTSENGNTLITFGDEVLARVGGVDVSSFTQDSFTSV